MSYWYVSCVLFCNMMQLHYDGQILICRAFPHNWLYCTVHADVWYFTGTFCWPWSSQNRCLSSYPHSLGYKTNRCDLLDIEIVHLLSLQSFWEIWGAFM